MDREKYKLDGKSFNIIEDNIKKLQELFPEIVTEGKVDIDKLALLFDKARNEDTEGKLDGEERYEFTWKGKKEAMRLAQEQSTGTLRPCREDSVNFDETENLYIEGDNLEVLRALQNSYRGKVKIIYIDPPYNTGKDFIYKDDFKDNIYNYKEKMNEAYKTNTKDDGRYHTNWLNMMYPRLKLARNLLTDDGVIFISIDDNEVANLKKICDEILGQNNFVGEFIILSNPRGSQASKHVASVHEYVLMYCKSINDMTIKGYKKSDANTAEYKEIDENGMRYRLLGLRQRGGAWRREDRPNMFYPIYINEKTGKVSLEKSEEFSIEVLPKRPTGEESRWTWGRKKFIEDIELLIGKRVNRSVVEDSWDIYRKDYLVGENGEEKNQKPKTIWDEKEMNYQNAKVQIKDLFGNSEVFDFPKPTFIVKKCIEMMGVNEEIVLDFFSGSGTTAQAIMEMNIDNKTNNKFILIQIPEDLSQNSIASKFECKNICDISKKRIKLAGNSIVEKNKDKEGIEDLDIGFKVFKLDSTNLKAWDENLQSDKDMVEQLEDLQNPIKEGRTTEDLVYEIMLKYGVDLTMPIEELEILGSKVYSVGCGYLMICLEDNISLDLIEAIGNEKPNRVVLADKGLTTSDLINGEKILTELGVQDIRTI
ncbi:site-specific DNA-methyltransferase [Clostridium perfringens]|uniref:site-specific DNA-methyltransferase n=1 Tax=Clostridium perfringens TaxID=1502 RepID=UPI00224666B5|nr:site-specific DNA-methyltransferase [Clostridium perfringens]MCX0388867.1 site-specific DNA-methyltransferase [Clostridium perfringens]MDM1014554.1 site-specific DNA-methyltransferase [Clostridium perfringens]MDZ5024837.1 site-specific DNA-methyltransferase [Clostridium perfringens]